MEASQSAAVVDRPVVSFFSTVHVEGEDEGEIEPDFYKQYQSQLGKNWRLYDAWGRELRLLVEFSDANGVPRITTGWLTLRRIYWLHGHHTILFKYFGSNLFQIFPNGKQITPVDFHTWHTRSRALRKARTWKLTITEDPEVHPCLTLPDEMGQYMCDAMLDEVRIVGSNGEKHWCSLEYQNNPFVVKIRTGWPEVVGINGFEVGDRVLFNTFSIYDDHMIWIRKVE